MSVHRLDIWQRICRFSEPRLSYLCISGLEGAENEKQLRAHGITHVYSLLCERSAPSSLTELLGRLGIAHHYIQIDDSVNINIVRVARKWYRTLDRERRMPNACILVHCLAGISRSASFVLYHLMRSWSMKLSDAYRILYDARSVIDPNPGFRYQLKEWSETQQISQYLCGIEAHFKSHRNTSQ